ncbi:MAG TPA: type II secretion system F family protein, partial [Desulfurivibrionaceae bacterium]|nr:type II secretion system F family protein [Desulfurivibrionaceae bacterium]
LLLGAGLSLDAALRTIKQHSHKGSFRDFVGDLERRLKEGKSFSETLAELRQLAVKAGFRPMYDDGLAKARQGLTSLAEVVRVCGR